jgi:hypothetical protein
MQIVARARLGYSFAERLTERIGDITGIVSRDPVNKKYADVDL